MNARVTNGVSVSTSLGRLVVAAALGGMLILGGIVYAIQYVIGHPLQVLGGIASALFWMGVYGFGLYAVCWLLAHRTGRYRRQREGNPADFE